jgi:uracil-DNA glycosylase
MVIKVEITQPINAQIGIVGEQPGATGDANQLHFNMPADQRANVFRYVPDSGKGL